ncbi:RluA family pseudouridine synthase [Gluconobacter morbifer]|uniref:Ribosomal large subunit pseudouridine synthase A n=1 Tax=Gluconobacter morbifer G707 TaxID=1088869 RepID=G6XJU4_9PROT|nr:RNA pseudouridine synthase [Gluconobacter morbifer]EHH67906.1 ribosomal large subunit pseudouridine synthase A [Gluconobacter morbifer G707]
MFREGCALPVLLETPRFLILNKPAGLAVHPGPSTRDSVETRLVPHPRGGPWLAHRLDADTAGCLLIARRKTALLEAQDAFRHRRTHKLYWAVVVGNPPEDSGSITGPLLKRSDRNGWRMVVDANGDNARTDWRVLGRKDGLCWLELDLLTGRTHQARAHCAAALGTPILGDPVYGTSCPAGLHLLARRLEVTVPESVLAAEASPSPAMAATLKDFGWDSQF